MKLSMNITERDKKLLAVLGIIVIGALFYFFALNPLYNEMNKAKSENQQLTAKKNELKGFETDLKVNKEKYDKQKIDYMAVSREMPNNLSEKYVISDTYKITKQVVADAESYAFSQRKDIANAEALSGIGNDSGNKAGAKGIYSYGATTNWKVSYADLKKLIKLSNTYESLFMMDNISITPEVGGKLNLSFVMNFIGYDDEMAPLRVFNGLNIPTGKNIIFSAAPGVVSTGAVTSPDTGKGNITSISTNNSITQIDKNKDFVVALSTVSSPTSSVVIEKSGDGKNIFGSNKSFENASINVSGKDGKYSFNMGTSSDKYPSSGVKEFKLNGKDIVILVYSTVRKGDSDKNIINIKINNETDKKVYVYVIGDDSKLPRCSVTKGGSNVYVEKR
ncbi:MAG: hypothetical protein RR645_02375 [Clostridium sp.]